MKNRRENLSKLILIVIAVITVARLSLVSGQIFDRLFTNNDYSSYNNDSPQGEPNRMNQVMRRMMSVNVPLFYDMVKNGTSMGINVLQGLVKVERGQEAERSGLTGHRPLSVRVFGVPVFERGTRIRGPTSSQLPPRDDGPKLDGPVDDEDLPIIS